MGKRRGKGRRKKKTFSHRYRKGWFLGLVITLSILSVFLFYIATGKKTPYTPLIPEKISKEVLEKRLKGLDNAVGRSLSSLGVKNKGLRESLLVAEIGGQLSVSPYREEFILSEGLASKEIEENLLGLLHDSGYKVELSLEEKEGYLIGRVFLDGYPSHILYLYYPPKRPEGMIAIVIDDIGYNMKTAR